MRKRILSAPIVAAILSHACAGCTSPLPTYEWRDPTAALEIMNRRDRVIKTFSSSCRLLLESKGDRVELTGALIANPPNHLRLRAWKLGQAVFDITLRPDGLFVFDRRSNEQGGDELRNVTHARLIDAVALLPGFGLDTWQVQKRTDDSREDRTGTFRIFRTLSDQHATLECEASRASLLRKSCTYKDAEGTVRQSLAFSEYAPIGTTVWPMRVDGRGEGGTFSLIFTDIELNADLPDRAFDPPRRAVRQP